MKIKFLPISNAPEYDIQGEVITATYNGQSESIDLSAFPEGGQWEDGETEQVELSVTQIIRDVRRENGELYVTLCQKVPVSKISYIHSGRIIATLPPEADAPEQYDKAIEHQGGNWGESEWIDSDDYVKGELYIQQL